MKLQVIKNGIVKGVLWITVSIIVAFLVATSLLRIPKIQTQITTRLTQNLSEMTGFEFELGYINLNWFDVLVLEDVSVKDLQDSTMILIPEASINFRISSFFNRDHRKLDKVKLVNAEVSLYKHNLDDPINITQFVDTLKFYLSGDRNARFSINQIELDQSILYVKNFTVDKDYLGFDLNKFKIKELSGKLNNFLIRSDTITFISDGLKGIETKTNVEIHEINMDFIVHQKSMGLRDLELKIGKSVLRDSLVFNYSRMSNLSYFIDSVQIQARLDKTLIHTEDLQYFASYFREIDDVYNVSGFYRGNAPNFSVRNLDLSFRNGSLIQGFLSFSGLPDFDETFMGIRLSNSFIDRRDLEKYLGENVLSKMSGINQLSFSGDFTGFANDFVAYGNFDTNLGKLESDINIKIEEEITTYEGRLITQDFDIGLYSGLELLDKIDMSGSIQGSGLTTEDADFVLDGNIYKMDINNYELTNIVTNARFATGLFEGDLDIDDPNLNLTATGSIDLREGKNLVNIKADLDTLVAHKLNLVSVPASMRSHIEIDGSGLKIDSIKGVLRMNDFHTMYDSNELKLQKLEIISKFDRNSRSLSVESDNISLDLTGQYEYTTVYRDILTLLEEYKLNLENESLEIRKYYSQKEIDPGNKYQLDISLDLRNINPLLNLFAPQVELSKEIFIEGSFTQGYTSILSLNTEFDSLRIEDELFMQNLVEINASKIADSINVLAGVYVSSESQQYSNRAKTQNLMAEAIWDRNQINFNVAVQEQNLESYADIYGELIFLPDLTVIKLNPSDLQALNEKWTIATDNSITISGKEISFTNIGLSKALEEIMLDGSISEDPDQALVLGLTNVELTNFDPVLTKQLRGSSNGFFQVKNYYNDLLFETDINIKDFMINDFLVGDVINTTEWNNLEKKFDLKFEVQRSNERLIDVFGEYYPGKEEGLDLEAEFVKADLKILEPFIEEVFSEFQGYATGSFAIKGNLKDPKFSGSGKILNGGGKINFLNTYYTFDGDLILKNNEIGLRNVMLQDRDGSLATFDGGFFFEGFSRFYLDFDGSFTDFLALNTKINEGELFYGTGKGTGDISVSGYPQNLKIDVNATTTSDTRIFIPLGGSSQVEEEEFIRFVSITELQEIEETELITASPQITGLDFTLDLLVTPDAYAEIIFDLKVGDIIRGRGNGDLKFQLSPLGEFTMYGDYQFTEGGYNFTLYNIVNKEFTILPDSRITWLGDPYGGDLDINASYEQLASVGPLLDTAYRDALEIKRRYPTQVILDLTGPLLTPEIDFNITIEDYPNSFYSDGQVVNLETELSAVRAEWDINEQELQKQVFSLIVLRQFSEEYFNTGGTVGSSVSEFISNQLSYWISQVDENLEIDISLGDLSGEAYNTFQLRLSYTFLDGRLRVTRDGGFTNPESQADVVSVLGDWSVEYMLTDNGNLRVRLFQKMDYNSLDNSFSSDNSFLKGGFSLMYTQSFDEVKEILESGRKNKIQETPEDVTSQNQNSRDELTKDKSGNNQ
jgi:hypothetical protein